ncbi:MAG: hypothetical protein WKF75_00410 [Singulisphaera sp.]
MSRASFEKLMGEPPVNDFAHSDPRYIAARDKLMEIKTDMVRLEGRIQAEYGRIRERRCHSLVLSEAHALVYGGESDALAPPVGEDLKKLMRDLEVRGEAEGIARKRMTEVETAVSREISTRLTPSYLAIAKRKFAALEALAAVAGEEHEFLDRLVEGGTQLGQLMRLGSSALGPSPLAEYVDHFRKEALDYYKLAL